MKLSFFSRAGDYYLLTFPDDQPRWELLGAGGRTNTGKPPGKTGLPVLAVIPDRYFFYYLPRDIQAKNRKTLIKAASLQIRNVFPAPDQNHYLQVMDTGSFALGLFRSPDLDSFLHKHGDDLALAGTVTTPFLLGLAMMDKDADWVMRNPGDPVILFRKGRLDYFSGDRHEYEQRAGSSEQGSLPSEISLDTLADRLRQEPVPWTGFRLALPELESGRGETGKILKATLVLLAVGLLFCSGQLFRLQGIILEKAQWENELDSLYSRALGPDSGPDPYGLLLYRADQAKDSTDRGLDFLDFLGTLSRAAPENLVVDSMTLGIDSGSVRASVDSYQSMEEMLEGLKLSGKYSFILDQADSSGNRVSMVLSFRF